jgi:K+-sensing histidine kinase KdpD
VISNLLSNVIRHTPHSGTIEVSVAHSYSQVRLEVADNGRESPPNFVQFAQAKRSADRAGGFGIGLPRLWQIFLYQQVAMLNYWFKHVLGRPWRQRP